MGELKIGRWVLGSLATNTYFLYREGEAETIVIDPADYGELVFRKLEENGLRVAAIFLTHGHFDHIYGVEALKKAANEKAREEGREPVCVYACEDEKELLASPELNISENFGRPTVVTADHYVKDGDVLAVCNMSCRVIQTPGHTEGGCCFYFEEGGFLVSGDTLFEESVGRTDFPTGSMSKLVRSVQEKLFVLPDETRVYSGHGEATTIGHEKQYNAYVQ